MAAAALVEDVESWKTTNQVAMELSEAMRRNLYQQGKLKIL
jgi:hypothetical protein